jgi:prepilin peptidase CpaA
MLPMMQKVVPMLPMLAMLVVAAVGDWRTRRIPNWLMAMLALSGVVASFAMPATNFPTTPGQSGLGLLVGFTIPFVLFLLGAVYGADVKMLAGIGAWLGPWHVFEVFIIQAIVGLLIVLVQCAMTGKLFALFRNSAVLAMNLAHVDALGVKHVSELGQSFKSVDRPLPYAVPVLVATIIVVTALM